METIQAKPDTYKGPVDESEIAARKRLSDAGKTTCVSTLPAPAD